MLENLINLVKEHASDAIVKNPAIPDKDNNSAIETVAGTIFSAIKGQMGSGGLEKVTDFFTGQGDPASKEITRNATTNAAENLAKKFGIPHNQATDAVSKMVPDIMKSLVNKTNDANDPSFDLNSIISSISEKGGFFDKIKKMF